MISVGFVPPSFSLSLCVSRPVCCLDGLVVFTLTHQAPPTQITPPPPSTAVHHRLGVGLTAVWILSVMMGSLQKDYGICSV